MARRTWLILAAVVVLLAGGWWVYRSSGQAQAPGQSSGPGAGGTAPAATGSENLIWASGKLLPGQWAGLSPAIAGAVRAVQVAEGDQVQAGQVLLQLEDAVWQSQLQTAEAVLAEAEAARARLLAGATTAQVAVAQAEVAAAAGGLAQVQAGLRQAQDAAAVTIAQVAIAQAQYGELASRPSQAERIAAQKQVDLAQAAVARAQAAYDTVRGNAHIGALPESMALQQATLELEAARANQAAIAAGATAQQLAVAQAQVEAARAQALAAQSQVPAAEAAVQTAEAQLARARAALDNLKAGATGEDRAAADARVTSGRAAVAVAQAQLSQTQVRAPFAGQVGNVLVRPGEMAVPGQACLMLGDTSRLRVETSDLRETDVTRLQPGMPAEVTFDALPGRTFRGSVTRIAPMSSLEKGSTNYTVQVAVEDLDPALRWGMTAFVNIRG